MFGLRIGAMGRVGSGLTLNQAAANVRAAYSTSPQVWYDPSDLTTLYQDSAGTTPVTAVGQPVGLMLDKSRGLVLGGELVSNGDFSNGLTGWTAGNSATLSVLSGKLSVAAAATTDNAQARTSFATVIGVAYRVSVYIEAVSGSRSSVIAGTFAGGSNLPGLPQLTRTGTFSFVFVATTTVTFLAAVAFDQNTSVLFDNISVRELPGLHASQPTALARPVLQQENGLTFLVCDGTDDGMVTPSWDLTSTDKVTVVAGVRKLSDAAIGVPLELSASSTTNNGTFAVFAPSDIAATNYIWRSKGNVVAGALANSVAAPITNVLTGLGDISGDRATLRVNGAQVSQITTDQGTGTYGNYPLYLFRRGGTTLPFNGRFYGLTIIGASLSASDITVLEKFQGQKAGVTVA